jgi:Arm DNA-binding domain
LAYLSLTQKVAPEMALADTAIRSAKGQEKPHKLGDSGGLFLLVQPSGGKLWRLKYRIDGVEKKLSLGAYPEVTLIAARAGRETARKLILNGVDPIIERQRTKLRAQSEASNIFGDIALEYINKREREGGSPRTLTKAPIITPTSSRHSVALPLPTLRPVMYLRCCVRWRPRAILKPRGVCCNSQAKCSVTRLPPRALRLIRRATYAAR